MKTLSLSSQQVPQSDDKSTWLMVLTLPAAVWGEAWSLTLYGKQGAMIAPHPTLEGAI